MKLTPYQLKALRITIEARESGPRVADRFVRGWKSYAVFVGVAGGLSVFYWWGGWPFASLFIAGFCCGLLWRDFSVARMHVHLWPLSREITNWARVAELLRENESSPPRHSLEQTTSA